MYFSGMKEKRQKAYRIKSYDEVLSNTIISMFTYKGLPDELLNRQNEIEEILLYKGACAIWKINKEIAGSIPTTYLDQYVVSEVSFTDDPDVYGMGANCICTLDNGIIANFKDWRNNPDIVVIFNNSNYSPDMNIGRFSDMLAELEVSLKLNILFARMYPMPVASTTKIQKAIETAIENMRNGKVATVLNEDALSQYVSDTANGAGAAGINTINLTAVEKSQYIQYLAKFRDDLMRWFYSLYGMNSQGSSKMAQQTVDEVNQDNNASMIIPHDMLRMRQNGIDELNKKFGWDAEVSFSECWMSRLANMDDEFKTTDEQLEEGANYEEIETETVEPEENSEGMDGEDEASEGSEGSDGSSEIEEVKDIVEEVKDVVEEFKEEVEDGNSENV